MTRRALAFSKFDILEGRIYRLLDDAPRSVRGKIGENAGLFPGELRRRMARLAAAPGRNYSDEASSVAAELNFVRENHAACLHVREPDGGGAIPGRKTAPIWAVLQCFWHWREVVVPAQRSHEPGG